MIISWHAQQHFIGENGDTFCNKVLFITILFYLYYNLYYNPIQLSSMDAVAIQPQEDRVWCQQLSLALAGLRNMGLTPGPQVAGSVLHSFSHLEVTRLRGMKAAPGGREKVCGQQKEERMEEGETDWLANSLMDRQTSRSSGQTIPDRWISRSD